MAVRLFVAKPKHRAVYASPFHINARHIWVKLSLWNVFTKFSYSYYKYAVLINRFGIDT